MMMLYLLAKNVTAISILIVKDDSVANWQNGRNIVHGKCFENHDMKSSLEGKNVKNVFIRAEYSDIFQNMDIIFLLVGQFFETCNDFKMFSCILQITLSIFIPEVVIVGRSQRCVF